MTNEEIQKLIDDAVSKATASRIAESRGQAKDAAGGAITPENIGTPTVMAALKKAGTVEQVRASRGFDPHGGKGLDFARMIIADARAKMNRSSPEAEAKALGYTTVAKALSEGSFADGGSLVHDQFSSEFIELLRPAMVCMASGVREIPFKGTLTFGRQNAAATAQWQGEVTAIVPSSLTTGELQLAAKKLTAATIISNDLLRNPNVSIEAMVRDDLVNVMGRKIDLALLEGTGTAYVPRGLDNWVVAGNQNNITGTAMADKVNDLGRAIRLVEVSNVPMTNCGWVLHPRTKWALITTLNSDGQFVFAAEMATGKLFGYPFKTTTATTISGSNYKFYFGEWSQLMLGVDTSMVIETLPNAAYANAAGTVVAGASTDETMVRAIGRYDSALRYTDAFSITAAVSY